MNFECAYNRVRLYDMIMTVLFFFLVRMYDLDIIYLAKIIVDRKFGIFLIILYYLC